mmetsp:Transcript_5434/g.9426  ORF Transcript_5434/g.9426 Transcript_5434/m.9426 type:complete len:208 (-) Transcript_5434:68-691(-)
MAEIGAILRVAAAGAAALGAWFIYDRAQKEKDKEERARARRALQNLSTRISRVLQKIAEISTRLQEISRKHENDPDAAPIADIDALIFCQNDLSSTQFEISKIQTETQNLNCSDSQLETKKREIMASVAAAQEAKRSTEVELATAKQALVARKKAEEKFLAFVEILRAKKFFENVEPGSPEYETRMQKARQKFNQRPPNGVQPASAS